MTNIELQNRLNAVISVLEDYDDNVEMQSQPSTYFINSNFYIQAGNEGFIDLDLENLDNYFNDLNFEKLDNYFNSCDVEEDDNE